jgi:hypothetical protein
MTQKLELSLSRRHLLAIGSGSAALGLGNQTLFAQPHKGITVRDRLWLWGHPAGAHDKGWGLSEPSRITPVEAAYYMSIPNVVMVRYLGKPEMPFDQYAIPFRPLKQVVWSVVGAGGETQSEERRAVLDLARKNHNFTGVQMDDFFFSEPKNGKIAALSTDELRVLRKELKSGPKPLDLWVTLYTYQLDQPIGDYLKFCDAVTLWTWKAKDLDKLPANFEKARKLVPNSRVILGCYMWDYGTHKPMPIEAMRRQAEQGLRWLQDGSIQGIIFLASCICDLNLEAVEWTRNWIHKVGDQKLSARA